jgi:transcriptional regulator with XRE-family HTH domain
MAEKDLDFGKRLERYIFEAGLSKKRLADMIVVSPSAIGAYINEGRIPEAPILLKIAQSLNISMEELLTGKKVGYPPREEKPLKVSEEESPIYNDKGDPELKEILRYFIDNPQDKKFCLKMIRGKKDIKEAVEGFVSNNLMKEEG